MRRNTSCVTSRRARPSGRWTILAARSVTATGTTTTPEWFRRSVACPTGCNRWRTGSTRMAGWNRSRTRRRSRNTIRAPESATTSTTGSPSREHHDYFPAFAVRVPAGAARGRPHGAIDHRARERRRAQRRGAVHLEALDSRPQDGPGGGRPGAALAPALDHIPDGEPPPGLLLTAWGGGGPARRSPLNAPA